MAKVKVTSTFIGTPQEVAEYGGQVPSHLKKLENKMSQGEIDSFRGRITAGTVMEVSDKRAGELQSIGVVELPKTEAAPASNAGTSTKKK